MKNAVVFGGVWYGRRIEMVRRESGGVKEGVDEGLWSFERLVRL